MSARKSSHRTIFLIVSNGSPLALIASSLRSTSKKPVCPMTRSLDPPMAHCGQRVRFVATWREEFFEVPYIKFWYGGVHLKTFYKTLKISMENLAKCKKAYWAAKSNAKQRAKEWKYTKEEWIGRWQERLAANGVENRGTRSGSSYVMCRIAATAPSSPDSTKCIPKS